MTMKRSKEEYKLIEGTSKGILINELEKKSEALYILLNDIVNESDNAKNSKESLEILMDEIWNADTKKINEILRIALKSPKS